MAIKIDKFLALTALLAASTTLGGCTVEDKDDDATGGKTTAAGGKAGAATGVGGLARGGAVAQGGSAGAGNALPVAGATAAGAAGMAGVAEAGAAGATAGTAGALGGLAGGTAGTVTAGAAGRAGGAGIIGTQAGAGGAAGGTTLVAGAAGNSGTAGSLGTAGRGGTAGWSGTGGRAGGAGGMNGGVAGQDTGCFGDEPSDPSAESIDCTGIPTTTCPDAAAESGLVTNPGYAVCTNGARRAGVAELIALCVASADAAVAADPCSATYEAHVEGCILLYEPQACEQSGSVQTCSDVRVHCPALDATLCKTALDARVASYTEYYALSCMDPSGESYSATTYTSCLARWDDCINY